MNTIDSSAWLQQALLKIDLGNATAYQQQISELLDEQPYFMGFLFNLEEDFSEMAHELLLRSTLAMHNGFVHTGLFFSVITQEQIEKIIDERIAAFEALEAQGETAFTAENIIAEASSPVALKSLYEFIVDNTTEDELPFADHTSLLLVLSAGIELLELAASPEDPDKQTETNA